MATSYNEIAGQSVERLATLSDGMFAVAMTLLVLDLRLPLIEAIPSEPDLWHALAAMTPQIVMYMMSFLTLGIFWVGQQTLLNHLSRSNRDLTWLHLAFLLAVTLMPFSTKLLAEFAAYRTTLLIYWANIVLLGAMLYLSWVCAVRSALVKHDVSRETTTAIRSRIIIGQSLYAFGALLCIFNTYWSIAFIVLVQLNYAIAPRIWRRSQ
jgi:TMEM175 potassium channel family protein